MQEKKPDELMEGMILADNCSYGQGSLLIAKGAVLRDVNIADIKARNIQAVFVEEDGSFIKKFKEIEERVDEKFKKFSQHPVMSHIAGLAKNYLKTRISRKTA
jgi:hypothetical protein